MNAKNQSENAKRWLKKVTRPYRASILALTFLTVFSTVFSLGFAYMVQYLVNSASDKNLQGLWIFSCCLLGLLLIKIALKTIGGYCSEKLRSKMYSKLRTNLFSKLLHADYTQSQAFHSGELLNRLTTDAQEVTADTVGLLPSAAGMIVQCGGSIVALLTINWKFTLLYVVCGFIFGGLAALFRRQLKKRQKDVLEADGQVRSYVQEGLGSVLTLKAYGTEARSTQKANKLSENYYNKRMKRNVLRALMNFVFALLSNFGLILAVVLCSINVYRGVTDDYGSILSVILLLMQMQQPITSFSSLIPVYYSRLASGERLAVIDEMREEPIAAKDDAHSVYETLQSISFNKVDFTYGREPILTQAISTINKGEIVCLTGPSGAGKSTVFKLLLNVYEPTSGELTINTNEGENYKLTAEQRGLFAYVPQGNFLFSGTIYENLTFFSQEKDENVLKQKLNLAIKTACAEFVYELPEGMQTPLLEKGGGLSEGQLQRLAVARAILSERPILLLDEATSALDAETEKTMLENIRKLEGKTCLIVTHRPAALAIADRILSVENGHIISK